MIVDHSNNHLTRGFVSLDSFRDLHLSVGSISGGPLLIDRNILAFAIRKFHQELSAITPAVEASIERLQCGADILHLAHQPNLLPYLNIFAQTFYLEHLASSIPLGCPVFFFVDHDNVSNLRFHTSYSCTPASPARLVSFTTKPYISNRHQIMSSVNVDHSAAVGIMRAAAAHLANARSGRSIADWLRILWPDYMVHKPSVGIVEFQAAPIVRTFSNLLGSNVLLGLKRS